MWRALAAALPVLLIVAIILGGILSGVFTATESASVAVIYTMSSAITGAPPAWMRPASAPIPATA